MILTPFQIKHLYRRLKIELNLEERCWLANFKGDFEIYEERLLQLAKKYNVSVVEENE